MDASHLAAESILLNLAQSSADSGASRDHSADRQSCAVPSRQSRHGRGPGRSAAITSSAPTGGASFRYTGILFHDITAMCRSRLGCARCTHPLSLDGNYPFACATYRSARKPSPGSVHLHCPPSVAGNRPFACATYRFARRPRPGSERLHCSLSTVGNHSFVCAK